MDLSQTSRAQRSEHVSARFNIRAVTYPLKRTIKSYRYSDRTAPSGFGPMPEYIMARDSSKHDPRIDGSLDLDQPL